ncbi:MAG: site-specific tyrosine recombinase XerD [Bacteroidetes bacterium]|nr:site-specific tyrosine recombinase XerD [Bacteroidota bacterium]
MSWNYYLQSYYNYLRLEKGLSTNTLSAYRNDITRYLNFMESEKGITDPKAISLDIIREFLQYLCDSYSLNDLSQARNISSIRSFHLFLLQESYTQSNPAELIDLPKITRKLPEVLSVDEIDAIFAACEKNDILGRRNRAMLELLYSSGLRVSELVNLRLSHIFLNEGIVRVIGKGNKERLVPLGESAKTCIEKYLEDRVSLSTQKDGEGILFLNRRGSRLTRNMVFMIIKKLCDQAGIDKCVSPHTFRHSFATHMIEGGADLLAVKEMLGHESVTTTEIYLHMDGNYLRQVHAEFHPRG